MNPKLLIRPKFGSYSKNDFRALPRLGVDLIVSIIFELVCH